MPASKEERTLANPLYTGAPPYTGAWKDAAYDPELPGRVCTAEQIRVMPTLQQFGRDLQAVQEETERQGQKTRDLFRTQLRQLAEQQARVKHDSKRSLELLRRQSDQLSKISQCTSATFRAARCGASSPAILVWSRACRASASRSRAPRVGCRLPAARSVSACGTV